MHFKTLGTPKDSEPLFSGTLSPIETLIPGDPPPEGIIRHSDINIGAIILILLFVSLYSFYPKLLAYYLMFVAC